MATPFRAPRTIVEALKLADSAAAARAAGLMDEADIMEAALRSVAFDPESVGIVRALRGFDPPVAREPNVGVTLRGFANQDIPAPSATSFEDMAQDIGRSVRSYEGLLSGRTARLRNQQLAGPAGSELRAAAQEGIDRAAAATQRERMATAAAIAGAAGLGGMIADTAGRFPSNVPIAANALAPEDDPMMEYVPPEVDMLPVDDAPIPEERFSPVALSDSDMGLTDFSPMDTADLAAEQRPLPESTPTVMPETLTPEEIAALRGQVVSIRDAKTGQAMDSFYPPESEEYKREQRMKLRYPQLRSR